MRGRGQGKHRDGNPCADAERGDQSGQETLNALARLPIYRVIVHLEITRMTLSPKDALEAAKLKRAQNQAAQEQQNAQQLAFPALAEQRLQEIEARLKAETPSELRLETQYNAAGDMGQQEWAPGGKGFKSQALRGTKAHSCGTNRHRLGSIRGASRLYPRQQRQKVQGDYLRKSRRQFWRPIPVASDNDAHRLKCAAATSACLTKTGRP